MTFHIYLSIITAQAYTTRSTTAHSTPIHSSVSHKGRGFSMQSSVVSFVVCSRVGKLYARCLAVALGLEAAAMRGVC